MGGLEGEGGSSSRSFKEACNISLTLCKPFKVSSKVASVASTLFTGSDSFLLGLMGTGDLLDFKLFSLLLDDMGYFQKSAKIQFVGVFLKTDKKILFYDKAA